MYESAIYGGWYRDKETFMTQMEKYVNYVDRYNEDKVFCDKVYDNILAVLENEPKPPKPEYIEKSMEYYRQFY